MRIGMFTFCLFLVACSSSDTIKAELSFVQESFLRDSVSIDLPTFEHGFPFVKYDSIDYVNIYLLNDSTVQVNDRIFYLKNNQKVLKADYPRKLIYKRNTDSIRKHLYHVYSADNQINLFVNDSVHYELYANLLNIMFENTSDKKLPINIFGSNDDLIQIRNSLYKPPGTIYCGTYQILDIMANSEGKILLKSDWDLDYQDIKSEVIEFYTNPDDKENLPRKIHINKKLCQKEIAKLFFFLKSSSNESEIELIKNKIRDWKKKLNYTHVLGPYETINSMACIYISLNLSCDMKIYFNIIDEINRGLAKLRNDLSLHKFDILYEDLNHSDSVNCFRKSAIDEVYPVIINPNIYFGIDFIQPPPSPEKY